MKKSITKQEINEYPLYEFKGELELIDTPSALEKAVDELKHERVLGFDTETRPAFKKGQNFDVALLQLATDKKVYLFRINKAPLTKSLVQILANPEIVKAGVAVRDDIKGLQKLLPFEDHGFIDVAHMAKEQGYSSFGLRALSALCLGKRISKGAKLTNWAQPKLTSAQVAYAATDAQMSLELYHYFRR